MAFFRLLKVCGFVVLFLWCQKFAWAQTSLESVGDCNQNISGDNNNVTVNCTIVSGGESEADTSGEVEVVVNFAGGPTVQTFARDGFGNLVPFYPDLRAVNQRLSRFELVLDGEKYAFSLADSFDGGFQEMESGRSRYEMETTIVFFNGFRTRAVCRGFLDIQSDADLVPRQNIELFNNGQIRSINCGFIANPI